MISPIAKRRLFKILPFGIVTFIFSLIYSFLEKGILGDSTHYPSTGNPYSFNILIPSITSFIIGLAIGAFEVFYLNNAVKKSDLLTKILFKTIIYFFIILIAIFIISTLSTAFELKSNPFDSKVWETTVAFFSSFALWSIVIYFTLGLAITLLYSEISDNIGQFVLFNFFTGKYHKPVEENRVFLFLDMKSSTTIAEKLGHVKYFELLKDYYSDLSQPIIESLGEIYQYVGDEVVVTWKLSEKNHANSLHCFFSMKKALNENSEYYISKYGLVPSFKAGIHMGKVTTGEIGKIKKDFVFTGDVLNTAARIQGLCNSYGVNLLASKNYVDALDRNSEYELTLLGETELRGKSEKIDLFAVEKV